MITFSQLQLEDAKKIQNFVAHFEPYSDFNFVSLYSWSINDQTLYCLDDDSFYIVMPDYTSKSLIFSFLCTAISVGSLKNILAWKKANNLSRNNVFKLLSEPSTAACQSFLSTTNYNYSLTEDPANYDYILGTSAIVKVLGSEFQDFRYKLAKLDREWGDKISPLVFSPLSKDHLLLVHELQQKWSKQKGSPNTPLTSEATAFERSLQVATRYPKSIRFKAYVIGNQLVGFASYELLPNSYAIAHFLSYDPSIRNIYYKLVSETCKDLYQSGVSFLNIEQDLGIPGLRQTKNHLRPIKLLKKYTLTIESQV